MYTYHFSFWGILFQDALWMMLLLDISFWWYNICKVENRTDDIVDITVIHGGSSMMCFPWWVIPGKNADGKLHQYTTGWLLGGCASGNGCTCFNWDYRIDLNQRAQKSSESWMTKLRLGSGVHNLRFFIWICKLCSFHVCAYDITTQLQQYSSRCRGVNGFEMIHVKGF